MGIPSCQHHHARHRDGQNSGYDCGKAPPRLCRRRRGRFSANRLITAFLLLICAATAQAETLRVATYNTELSRDGPGLLLRDILRGTDPQIDGIIQILRDTTPDIVVLQGFDYDLENKALHAFADALAINGPDYPFRFALPGNAGRQTTLDLDGDTRLGGPGDAQGFGRYFGQGGMAILSRYPVLSDQVQDYTAMLWADLPDALLPQTDNLPFPSAEAQAIQRLSSHGHWVVPIDVPDLGTVTLLTFHASPPVFDGPEDRNGKRNHDEIVLWQYFLDARLGPVPETQFVLLGDANLDPILGEGIKPAITGLIADSRLQDPLADQHTVTWDGVGKLRVDYVLPSADWAIRDSGIYRPDGPSPSRHDLVWVDLAR